MMWRRLLMCRLRIVIEVRSAAICKLPVGHRRHRLHLMSALRMAFHSGSTMPKPFRKPRTIICRVAPVPALLLLLLLRLLSVLKLLLVLHELRVVDCAGLLLRVRRVGFVVVRGCKWHHRRS